jgi:MFS family permease
MPGRPGGDEEAGLGPTFHRLWAATSVMNFGDGILLIGLPLLAAQFTRSPLLVSLVSALARLPWLLVALHAGALADRYDRRRIIVTAAWLRAATLTVLMGMATTGAVQLPVVYIAVLTLGVAEVFADTTTQSVLPMIVDRRRLGAANGRIIATQQIANDFLGGPAAGLLVAAGAASLFGLPALLYAGAGLVVLTLPGSFQVERSSPTTLRTDIAEGIRYLYRHRVLRSLAILAGSLNFAAAAYLAVFVLWAVGEESRMQLTSQAYGSLFAALAAGGMLGALVAERASERLGEVRILLGGAVGSSVLLLVPALAPRFPAALAAFVMIGLGSGMTNVAIVSLRQRLIPDRLLGRVNASYRLIGMGTMPVGAFLGGVLGSVAGLVSVFVSATSIALMAIANSMRHVSAAHVAAAEEARDDDVG